MSPGLVPVFNPPVAGGQFQLSGAALLNNAEKLEEIADEAGLEALTRFTDMREVPEDFDGTPEELDAVLGEWSEWFDAEWGSEAASALMDLMQQKPAVRKLLEEPVNVEAELRELVRVLKLGTELGAEFRLEVSLPS